MQISVDKIVDLAVNYGTKIGGALLLLLAGLWIAGKVKKLVMASMTRANLDTTLTRFAGNISRWAVLIAIGVTILGVFGIQTASFAAVIAASGLAVGLAFQGTLANFAAGVMLLVFRPFSVGQFIKVGGESGTVNEIDLFTTKLDTPDNRLIIVPNAAVFGATIENVSAYSTRRIDVNVGVDYDASIETTRSVLTTAIGRIDGSLKGDKAPVAVLCDLGASSVDWQVRVWCDTPDYWAVRERVVAAVKNSLDAAGIGIPYPQLDLHLPNQGLSLTNGASAGDSAPANH